MKAHRWRHGALLGLVMVAALVAAGCGDNTNDTGGGSTGTTAAAPAVDQALAAKVPAEIKSDGKLVIGVDSSYPPNEYLDTDGKTVIGWDVDLFNAVAAKLGLKTEWRSAVFDAIIPGIDSAKYEMGVSSFFVTDDRKKQVDMVSYYNVGTQWLTKKGNPKGIQPDAACGKKVAVQTNTAQDTDDLAKRQEKCKADGKPAITIDRYQRQDQATASVVSGKDDATLADSPVMAYAVKQTNGQLELLGDAYDTYFYGSVLKKGQDEFAQAVADAVSALISDGTYKTILEKWGVQAGAVDSSTVNP